MTDKFHRAARDGICAILKEATRKDCNQPDEDGLTPTAYAAHEGHLDALRILVRRGGDPDKCDLYGNTSLHCASAKGHMPCVSFLVNFGVNIWALDNDFHTALELAAINDKDEVVRFIDGQAAKQEQVDIKKAKKGQEKAKKDAEKRQKEFDKIQKKADKKREEDNFKHQKDQDILMTEKTYEQHEKITKKKSVFDTISKSSFALIKGTKEKDLKTTHSNSPRFSELTQNSINANKKAITGGIQRKILKKKIADENKTTNEFKIRETEQDGKKSTKNLYGLQRDSEILFVPNKSLTDNNRGKLIDMFGGSVGKNSNNILQSFQQTSLFDRPGFGSVAFRNSMTSALRNIPSNVSETSEGSSSRVSADDAKEPSREILNTWEEDELLSEEEEEEEEEEISPLLSFLSANGFQNYMPQFTREQIDLEALMLLTDQDLEQMKIHLGPRRKLLKVLNERRLAQQSPIDVTDVKL